MAHKTLIGGTGYDIKGGRTLIGGTGYDIKSGRTLIGGTGYNISFGTPLGNFAVGSSVYLNEAGAAVEYLIVHQGLPSSMYDASCNGTWLLRKDILENRQWSDIRINDWANSSLKAYLDSTFLGRFDSGIQNRIKQVKIPYMPGTGGEGSYNYNINSGSNGLLCKIFLLSSFESGSDGSDSDMRPLDGALLSYFIDGKSSEALSKRVAYLSGSASDWWTRSARRYGKSNAWEILSNGYNFCRFSNNVSGGVRPAIILPSDTPVPDSHLIA